MQRLDFCIVGAMKAATTTLATQLSLHPSIVMAYPKEPGFFSRDDRYARGIAWYRGFFQDLPGATVGEASTCYSRSAAFPLAAERLAQFSPNVKIVYVLRHPLDRAIAHYVHEMRVKLAHGKPLLGFYEYTQADPAVVSASRYDEEIRHLARWFSIDQMHFVRFEDFVSDQPAVVASLLEWMGLDPVPIEQRWDNRGAKRLELIAHRARWQRFKAAPVVHLSSRLLPRPTRSVARMFLEPLVVPGFRSRRDAARFNAMLELPDGEQRAALLAMFSDSISAVEDITGWDLAAWRK